MPSLPAFARRLKLTSIAALAFVASPAFAADPKPTPIAEVKHDGPVDFQKEILPILKKNCTACHNKAKAESDLVLESPESILKGGSSGPAAIAKKGLESLLVTRSAAADDEQMPPAGNNVGASRLTSQQLGLIELWIDQGATGTVSKGEQIVWQPLPAGVNPVFAVALTADGQYVACSRANQIFLYHVPSGRVVGRLTDPALLKSGIYNKPGVADLDLIQSLAFSPDGATLASGGFRTIKLWKRGADAKKPAFGGKLAADVKTAVVSPDGKLLAVVLGNDVQLADVAADKLTAKLSGHTAAVNAAAFSPDGTKILTVSADKTARLWNVADGKLFAKVDAPAELTAAAITADGATFVIGAADGKLASYALPKEAPAADAKLAPVKEWSGGKRIAALAANPAAGTQVIVADEAGNVTPWNTADVKKSLKPMTKAAAEVRVLAVNQAGTKIYGLGADNALRIWNAADGKPVAEAKGDVRAVRNVAAADRAVAVAKAQVTAEKALLTEAEKSATTEAEAAKKAEEAKVAAEKAQKEKTEAAAKALTEKQNAEKASTAAAAEQKKADDAKAAGEAAVAKAEQDEKAAKDPKAAAEKTKAARTALTALTKTATDAATKAKAAVAALEKTAKPLEDANKAKSEADSVLQSSTRAIASAAAASKRAAAAVPVAKKRADDAEAAQKKLEAALEEAKKLATAAEKPFRSLAFSPDGKLLAVGGDDMLVHTFDAETAAPLDVFVGHGGSVLAVAFAGEDRITSIAADRGAFAWSLYPEWTWSATIGDPASETLVDRVTALDFSPDGKLIASGGGVPSRSGELKIWSATDGKLVREVADAHSDTVFSVRFSPDGKTLASGAADKFIKTFEVATGKFIRGYEGHTHHVLGVAWSADGRMLASAGADNVVKSWDVASGEQKKTIPGFGKEVTGIMFVGATNEAIAASGDKTVRMMKADAGQMGKTFSGSADFLYCCAVTLDGAFVAAGGQDGIVRIWDVKTGTEVKNFAPPADTSNQQAQK